MKSPAKAPASKVFRRTKIVGTIGPASRDPKTLRKMIEAGLNVVRINMSHGTHEEHAEVIKTVRELEAELHKHVAILQDLAGPKIRLGIILEDRYLPVGEEVTIMTGHKAAQRDELPVEYDALLDELSVGDQVSLADGAILLEVAEILDKSARCVVLSGGDITSHKGVHLPSGGKSLPAMTQRDAQDMRFGLENGVDMVALSFVRSGGDAAGARRVMDMANITVPLIAKIERRQAVENIDEILAAFDGLMVARGDLGVELPLAEVPAAQKKIIRKANDAAKPVITATQMLLSMVSSPRPTRAEVADVANAILDGTDAVMLSEETAKGANPIDSIRTMSEIAIEAEKMINFDEPLPRHPIPVPVHESIARAVRKVAMLVGAKLIISPTATGGTPRLVASTRPPMPILALASTGKTVRSLAVSFSVKPHLVQPFGTAEELFDACRNAALDSGLAEPGDIAVLAVGYPFHHPGKTNMLHVMDI